MNDLIDRLTAVDAVQTIDHFATLPDGDALVRMSAVEYVLNCLPSAQPEPLTDKEQRIFLAAMEKEEKVCEEVDRNYVREPYEDSLMSVCREIKRKVKGALWT